MPLFALPMWWMLPIEWRELDRFKSRRPSIQRNFSSHHQTFHSQSIFYIRPRLLFLYVNLVDFMSNFLTLVLFSQKVAE